MVKKIRNTKGFIAILSLLIITTISMIIAMTLLKDGVDNASLSLTSIAYENSRLNAVICFEDTLIRMKMEEKFDEVINYDLGEGQSCTGTITWYTTQEVGTGRWETLADLEVSGTDGNFTRTYEYSLKVRKTAVNHTNGTVEYMNSIDILSIEELSS